MAKTHSVRIIGGQWRGRKLAIVDQDGLRPTGDRIRETLFNWLQPNLSCFPCIDLFAGTGSLGFEALSRGAPEATLIEQSPSAYQALKVHQQNLNAKATLIKGDALNWLEQQPCLPSSLVFVDPPFQKQLWQRTLDLLDQKLTHPSWVYIETPRDHSLTVPPNWHLHRQKSAGSIRFSLYHLN